MKEVPHPLPRLYDLPSPVRLCGLYKTTKGRTTGTLERTGVKGVDTGPLLLRVEYLSTPPKLVYYTHFMNHSTVHAPSTGCE